MFANIRVIIISLAIFISHPVAAQHMQFSDCSNHAVSVLKHRIYTPNKKLSPLILSRDVLHLSICNGVGAGMKVGPIEAVLGKDYELEMKMVSIDPKHKDAMAEAARDACIDQSERACVVEIYRRKDYKTKQIIPFGKSGGLPFGQFLGHLGVKGHFEITGLGAAAQSINDGTIWTAPALAILQDASRDPDFYEWGNPLAHAQTSNFPNTGLPDLTDAETAPERFEVWSSNYLSRAAQLCVEHKPREALYLLGYALHGIQDLVFHEGITNAEHAFRDFIEDEQIDAGDHYNEKMAMATLATRDLLHEFSMRLNSGKSGCWKEMTTLASGHMLNASARETLLHKAGKDFGIRPYFAYHDLATTVRNAIVGKTYRKNDFFIQDRWLKGRQQTLLDGFVTRILSKMTNQ